MLIQWVSLPRNVMIQRISTIANTVSRREKVDLWLWNFLKELSLDPAPAPPDWPEDHHGQAIACQAENPSEGEEDSLQPHRGPGQPLLALTGLPHHWRGGEASRLSEGVYYLWSLRRGRNVYRRALTKKTRNHSPGLNAYIIFWKVKFIFISSDTNNDSMILCSSFDEIYDNNGILFLLVHLTLTFILSIFGSIS